MKAFLPALAFLVMVGCNSKSSAPVDPCASAAPCENDGLCKTEGSRCVPDKASCERSTGCRVDGKCTVDGNDCVAASNADCQASEGCAKRNACTLVRSRGGGYSYCREEDTREGCPCGCDHSEEMANALRREGGESAASAIDATLRTIAEREDAGYITEAMVQHRLRLLGLAMEAGVAFGDGPGERGRGVPLPSVLDHGEARVTAADRSLRVTVEMSAHGETTEIVRGQPKLLRSSFRVGLTIENAGAARRTLSRPEVEGDGAKRFSVSRWYVVGDGGAPWDGATGPGETTTVNVIGYLDPPVAPGTQLGATVSVGGLSLHAITRAREAWDQPAPRDAAAPRRD